RGHLPMIRLSHRLPPVACCLLLLCALPASAAVPTDAAKRSAVVGQPASLLVQPPAVGLVGPRARQQIVVTGRYADGSVRDLTPLCDFSCDNAALAAVDETGFITPRGNGAGTLVVKAGGQTASVALTVKDFDKPQPVSFRRDLIAALNVGGC